MIGLVCALVVIGVLLWALNSLAAPYIDSKILRIINVVVVVCVVLWLLRVFGVFTALDVPVPRIR